VRVAGVVPMPPSFTVLHRRLLTEIQAIRVDEAAGRHAAEIAGVSPSTAVAPFNAASPHDCGLCDRTLILSEVCCTSPEHAGVVVCCEHARKLCVCPMTSRALRIFCTLDDIDAVISVVKKRLKKLSGVEAAKEPPSSNVKPGKKQHRARSHEDNDVQAVPPKLRVIEVEVEAMSKPPVLAADCIDLTEEDPTAIPLPQPVAMPRPLCDLCFEDIDAASATWLASLTTPLPSHEVETMKTLPPVTCCLSCKLAVQTSVDQWNAWCQL
jgi:hypothetical protein